MFERWVKRDYSRLAAAAMISSRTASIVPSSTRPMTGPAEPWIFMPSTNKPMTINSHGAKKTKAAILRRF